MKKILVLFLLFTQVSLAQTLDIVVLGSRYKNPSEKAQFLVDADIAKYETELRLAYRKKQIVWHIGVPNGNYSCAIVPSGTFGSPALVCDDYDRIYKDAISTYADFDIIVILVNKMGYGSGNGIVNVGSGFHDYDPAAFGSKVPHEMGHAKLNLGFEHTQGTIMGDATSGGNALINMTFSLSQMITVNAAIDDMAGAYPIDEPLDVIIESPYNGQVFNTSTIVRLWANTNYDDNVYKYQVIVTQQGDAGHLIGEFLLWERNKWNAQYDIKRDIGLLPAGNYTIEIRMFNAVQNYCSETVNIIVE